jgi:hypothetical protein
LAGISCRARAIASEQAAARVVAEPSAWLSSADAPTDHAKPAAARLPASNPRHNGRLTEPSLDPQPRAGPLYGQRRRGDPTKDLRQLNI